MICTTTSGAQYSVRPTRQIRYGTEKISSIAIRKISVVVMGRAFRFRVGKLRAQRQAAMLRALNDVAGERGEPGPAPATSASRACAAARG